MKSSKVLIMIPAYNCEEFIARSLDSCLLQTRLAEIWVVDNCSTDKTQDIVRQYRKKSPLVKLIVNKTNLGRVGNWNRCLELFEKSEFQYIKFVFSGDEIMPYCVEEVEEAFKKDKQIGAVVFPYLFVRTDGSITRDTNRRGNKLFSKEEINHINLAKGGLLGAIICDTYNKKFVLGKRFNEMFMGKSDFDFDVLSNSKAYFLDKVLARYNVDAHRTLKLSQEYRFETEVTFNRMYWLDKIKNRYSSKEYMQIKEQIMIESMINSVNYFKLTSYINLAVRLLIALFWKYYIGIISQTKKRILGI